MAADAGSLSQLASTMNSATGPASAEMSTTSIFHYTMIPATAAARLRTPATRDLATATTANINPEGQPPSTSALERFYSTSNPLLSNLHPEMEADLMQKGEKKGGGLRSMSTSLRSPLAGDLASPQYHYITQSQTSQDTSNATHSTVKPSSHVHHAHTPTLPSSAALEVVAVSGQPSTTPHSVFPVVQPSDPGILDSSSAVFLPQTLSELVLPPATSSPSSSPSAFQLGMNGDDSTDSATTGPSSELAVCLWDSCHQEFSSLHHLVTHLDRAHTLAMTQFICLWEGCSRKLKPFDARYKLITHLRCHTGEKPYRCEVSSCKRSFSRLENLKLHTRTHTGEKPYQCDFVGCTKKFNNTSDRAKHKKTHITRKPYACKYPGCGKSYTDPSSMRKHIKYTHKLKEETERTGLSLITLPKRKRNSASSSSSSSSTSSTPHTPQHISTLFLNSPKEAPALLQGMSQSPAAYGHGLLTGSPVSSKPQLIPMVKIAGRLQDTQQVLLPAAYQQQQPVMMILTNSSPPAANWVSVASSPTTTTTTSQQPATNNGTSQTYPVAAKSSGSGVEFPDVQVSYTTTPAELTTASSTPSTSSTSGSNMEAQLRLQIAHLQQQLYQSQLAAARATQRLATAAPVSLAEPQPVPEPATRLVASLNGRHTQEKIAMSPPLQLPMSSPAPSRSGAEPPSSLQALLGGVKTIPVPLSPQLRTPERQTGSVVVSSPEAGGGVMGTTPQYIPIPIIQPQDVTATQYLYMSP